jgi:hypothetical protein
VAQNMNPDRNSSNLFSYANPYLLEAVLHTTKICEVHASEDIVDIGGTKLWSAGKCVDAHLIERLSDRRLRKPIELCILCRDPVATSGIVAVVESLISENEAFRHLVAPQLDAVVKAIRGATPNPTELLLITVLRHGPREIHSHAAAVTAIALALAASSGLPAPLLQQLVHAGMLHDVGELYMDSALFRGALSPGKERQIMEHAVLGARATLELAKTGPDIALAIRQSHERLNGSGYPDALSERVITTLAKPLLVAEGIASLVVHTQNGLIRASIATRLVPGEFPQELINTIHKQSRNSVFSTMLAAPMRQAVVDKLLWAQKVSQQIAGTLKLHDGALLAVEEQALLGRVGTALSIVRRSISTTGALESMSGDASSDDRRASDEFEAEAVSQEVMYRLRRLLVELCGALERDWMVRGRPQIEEFVTMLQAGLG